MTWIITFFLPIINPLIGILNSIISGLSTIVYKKALLESKWKISDKYYQFFSDSILIFILPLFYLFFSFELIDLRSLIILSFASVLSIISQLFWQYAYKNEKISVLVPYWEFESVFTIFVWFFVFSDSSLFSFIFAIFAWFTLVFWWLNIKKMKFNKYCLSLLISAILSWLKYIIYWILLLKLSEYSIIIYDNLIMFFLLLLSVIYTKEFLCYKKIKPKLFKIILLDCLIWVIISFITLFLIKELWLVLAVLIWMLYIVTTLFFSYIFFNNKPSNKDILIVIIVSIFITLWNIFW